MVYNTLMLKVGWSGCCCIYYDKNDVSILTEEVVDKYRLPDKK